MAEKTETKGLPERIYTIPLRGMWVRSPKTLRAKRSASAIRGFLMRHTKAGSVKISEKLNHQLWARGIKKPPGTVRVKAHMDEDGVVTAMLPDEVVAKEAEKGRMEKLKEKITGGREEKPKEGVEKETEKTETTKREGRYEKEKRPETPKKEAGEEK